MPISILIISHNPVLLQQLERFITQADGLEVKATMQKLTKPALAKLVVEDMPVVVWVMRWPLQEDIVLLEQFCALYPQVGFIAVSPLELVEYETAIRDAGGAAYLTEKDLNKALVPAIYRVAQMQDRYVSR